MTRLVPIQSSISYDSEYCLFRNKIQTGARSKSRSPPIDWSSSATRQVSTWPACLSSRCSLLTCPWCDDHHHQSAAQTYIIIVQVGFYIKIEINSHIDLSTCWIDQGTSQRAPVTFTATSYSPDLPPPPTNLRKVPTSQPFEISTCSWV